LLALCARLCYTETMKYDYAYFYNKNASFYNAHTNAKRALKFANFCFTWLFFIAYGVLWTQAMDADRFTLHDFVKIIFVPLLALCMVTVLRLFVERPRPYAENGAGIEPLVKKKADNKSFPSRHLACATAIAMTFLPFYPLVGGLLFLASFVLGYTRFALGLHYPSDLVAGWSVGTCIGCLIFIL